MWIIIYTFAEILFTILTQLLLLIKRLLLFLLLCIWAVSCVNDFDIAPPDKRAEGYSIEEARAFFDDYVAALPEIKTRAYDDHSLFGIDLSPQWDKAVASSRNSLSSIDIPILKNRQLMARTSGVPLYINSLQKLVIVKDHEIDVQGAYLLTLVPDLQYSHNKQLDPNNFVNLGDKNNYSGLAIYSLPLTEHIVRIDRYKDGEKIEGYGLFGTHEENHKALDRMKTIFGSISFGIGEMVQTRTIIEGGTLPPVIVTPDRCSWCGSTSCDGWCWTGGGGNTLYPLSGFCLRFIQVQIYAKFLTYTSSLKSDVYA